MSDHISLWLHLLGLGAYFGSTLVLVMMVLPSARRIADAAVRQTFLASHFKLYNPLTIAALGVQVMTGAFNLTRYKALLMGEFFAQMGSLLAWKLALVFLLVMNGTYISFGLGHRIVRHEEWHEQLGDATLSRMQRRLMPAAVIALILTAIITWVALRMTHSNPSGGG